MKTYNHKNKTINIRVDEALAKQIQEYADKKRITISELTRSLLVDFVCDRSYVSCDRELASI
jgi:hypothetical protein